MTLNEGAGKLIQEARDEACLSQLQLAIKAKVSVATISDIETGRNRTPRRRTVNLIAKVLDLDTNDLGLALEEGAA